MILSISNFQITLLSFKKLKKAREKLGLTQKQVSEKAGVSTNWYSRFERGEENALQETRDAILKVLKVKVEYKVK